MWGGDLRPIRIADFYGKRNQVVKAMEECGELTSALARVAAHGPEMTMDERIAMVSELADVSVMIDQMVYLFDAHTEFRKLREAKLARQMRRMREEEKLLEEIDNGSN